MVTCARVPVPEESCLTLTTIRAVLWNTVGILITACYAVLAGIRTCKPAFKLKEYILSFFSVYPDRSEWQLAVSICYDLVVLLNYRVFGKLSEEVTTRTTMLWTLRKMSGFISVPKKTTPLS